MQQIKKDVNFFTHELNVSFVQQEIKNLSKVFEQVTIFSFKTDGDFTLPPNVKVLKFDYADYSTSKIIGGNFFLFLGLAITEFFRTPKYLSDLRIYFKALSELLRSIYLKDWIKKQDAFNGKDVVFYSFWFNQWATALSILVKEGAIPKYSSRVHGTDLYEYRVPKTHTIPFRPFQLKYVEGVYSVSKKGMDYLQEKYPMYKAKIKTAYLGSEDHGIGPFDETELFTIVSCANVRNIKRIHLIPEILTNLEFNVKWIHIGNENLQSNDPTIPLYKKNKQMLSDRKNIVADYKGALSNEEVYKLYSSNSINLFISVSETEGLPVSMMEATSFGIPVISTDVGGCNEIVTEKSGLLIEKDFEPTIVAAQIDAFRLSGKNALKYRKGTREFWEEHFNGEKNFNDFCNKILAN